MQVLCGDIGGTKTRMAIADIKSGTVSVVHEALFDSASHSSLEEIIHLFMDNRPVPGNAAFGIAGPVRDGRCHITNLPWLVDARELIASTGIRRVRLLNDLEATAWGIGTLGIQDLKVLNTGHADPMGNQSVIAAGTGLGQAGICFQQGRPQPFASEGGHSDYAPSGELEFALHAYLADRYGHVSWERLVSGMGLVDIFRFMCRHTGQDIPDWFEQEVLQGDAGAAVSRQADAGVCATCEMSMQLFVRLYARESGNHALKLMATGGVFLGGGIAPKILHRLVKPDFLEEFTNKGRMSNLMRKMPVKVILNDAAALRGAARVAAEMQT